MKEKNNRTDRDALDKVLGGLEFPGEDSEEILAALRGSGFASRVMEIIHRKERRRFRSIFWILFILLDIALLLAFGTDRFVPDSLFFEHGTLESLVFTALGLILFGGVLGFVLTFDRLREDDEPSFFDRLGERFKELPMIRSLFR